MVASPSPGSLAVQGGIALFQNIMGHSRPALFGAPASALPVKSVRHDSNDRAQRKRLQAIMVSRRRLILAATLLVLVAGLAGLFRHRTGGGAPVSDRRGNRRVDPPTGSIAALVAKVGRSGIRTG